MKKPTNTADNENHPEWLFGQNSNAIEAQEARGQAELVASDTLPTKGLEKLKEIGVEIIGPVEGDDLFSFVRLPPGWSKQATGHSMWNKLLDEKGRERASFFYKAAFYDRRAHINASARYRIDRDWGQDDIVTMVHDGEKEIYRTEAVQVVSGSMVGTERRQLAECEAWLKANRGVTDWRNPALNWED